MKNKLLIIIIVLLIIIIAILAFTLFGNKKPGGIEKEQPGDVSGEYLTRASLGKLKGDEKFDPSKVVKTSVFSTTDQFCMILDIKKNIPAGVFGLSVYDQIKGEDVTPKANFPQELKMGNMVGCEPIEYPVGQYEQRIYINDVLVATLSFEVK